MKKRIYILRYTFLIAIFMCCYGCELPDFGYDGDGGDGEGEGRGPWTSVTKLEIRPDTASVGDTVSIKITIRDSLATGTKYYWNSAAFEFLDGNLSGSNYMTEIGENRVYLSPSDIPNSAFSTDTTVLSWGWGITIANAQNSSFGKQYKLKIKKR